MNNAVSCCLGNIQSLVKGVKSAPIYKHYRVKIKSFGRLKLFFTDTAYEDLGDKPQTC